MGLAPYGEPRFAQLIWDNLVDIKSDGSFRLNMAYFDYCIGTTMTNRKFDALFGAPPRRPEAPLTRREMDIAASIQQVTEEIILRLTRSIAEETGMANLCLAGGVALNCVANGKVLRDGRFRNLWIQPASGDAGGAVGAALSAGYLHAAQERIVPAEGKDGMQGGLLGPSFDQSEIEESLTRSGARYIVLDESTLMSACAETLADGKVLAWFQGRMEFGPRSLGARSILGDARSPGMQSMLNLKVKFRESFRPFAPSVLAADAADWFDLHCDSPYMLLVANVVNSRIKPMGPEEQDLFGIDKLNIVRSDIPAVTHVDYSSRVQTVHADTNPRFYQLISAFKKKTGCPVLVNTSFNVRGEPIVCTPEDALHCFMGTDIDVMAIGNCLLMKEQQDCALKHDYRGKISLD
jgi:carbamoyltransferase